MTKYEIQYSAKVKGEPFFSWGFKDDLSAANQTAQGLTFAPDIAIARVVRDGKTATEYGRNGILRNYRNDV